MADMIGPCLCGDPCCPNCGDPGAAALEDAISELAEDLGQLLQTPVELAFLKAMMPAALEAYRAGVRYEVDEAKAIMDEDKACDY